jgi:SAM-dependent methyltransferase
MKGPRDLDHQKYIEMQKSFYERDVPPETVVPNTEWNDKVPHETMLLYRNCDIRYPIFDDFSDKVALDFACGPGRMVPRLAKFFARVDGVDISKVLVAAAKERNPASNFWVSTGDNLGDTPLSHYDFIYSTVALQHIAVHSVRMSILRHMTTVLKPGGCVTLQFAFNFRFPYTRIASDQIANGARTMVFEEETRHARWHENRVEATTTNSGCDVGIGREDIPRVVSDFEQYFNGVQYWFFDYSHCARGPKGIGEQGGYWPTHFLMVHGVKK